MMNVFRSRPCREFRLNATSRFGVLILMFLCVWLSTDIRQAAAGNDYEFRDFADGVEITDYLGVSVKVEIPAEIGGKPVRRIGTYAFYGKRLTSVTIPEGVAEIGASAFYGNDLRELNLPDSIEKIETYALADNQLTSLYLGPHVTDFPGNAISVNPIETIRVAEDNPKFMDIDGKGVYTKDGKVLIAGTLGGIIANTAIEVGPYAFHKRGISSVALPDSVTIIGVNAFSGNHLVHVKIPDEAVRIDSRAFMDNNLVSVELGENLEYVGGSAFSNNRMTEISIPDNVLTIEAFSFSNNQLKHVKIGVNLEGGSVNTAFRVNPLEIIEVSESNANYEHSPDGKGLYVKGGHTLVVGTISGEIREGTKEIAAQAFSGRGLQNITIPDSVEVIGTGAFSENRLSTLDIPDSVKTISADAFVNNALERVTIGEQLKQLHHSAFSFNPLKMITVNPNNPTFRDIEGKGVYSKDGTTLVVGTTSGTIAEGTETIGRDAFAGRSLEGNLSIPGSVKIIEWAAFFANDLLRVTIPESVTTLQLNLFGNNPDIVIVGKRGSKAEDYAIKERIPFLAPDTPLAVRIDPFGHRQGETVSTKVTVYSHTYMNTEQYYIWTPDPGPPVFDADEWEPFQNGAELTQTNIGLWYLHIYARDPDNHEFYYSSEVFRVIDPEPVIIVSATVGPAATPYIEGMWAHEEVSLTIRAEDVNMKQLKVRIRHDGNEDEFIAGAADHFTIQRTLNESGIYELSMEAEDEAGMSTMEQWIIRIDLATPEIRFEPDGGRVDQPDLLSEVTVTDDHSGVDEDSFRYLWSASEDPLDEGADWSAFRQGEKLAFAGTRGTWYLHVRAGDQAGNEQYKVSRPFIVRGGAPAGNSVYRSGDANIREFEVSAGSLTPSFSGEITDYWMMVDPDVDRISLSVTAAHREAEIFVNGERLSAGQATFELSLEFGVNRFDIEIKAEDGTGKVYTLLVERSKPAFSDLAGHWAETLVYEAASRGLINGYPDGTFMPDRPVTRAEFVVMLAGALQFEGTDTSLYFTDVEKIGPWARHAVAQALQLGIVAGYDDGSFRPHAQITRAEMAVMIARALNLTIKSGVSPGFADDADIPHWAAGAVEALRQQDLVHGRDGGRFAPGDATTRAEAVAMLLRILDIKAI